MLIKVPSWAKNVVKKMPPEFSREAIPAYSKQVKLLSRGISGFAGVRALTEGAVSRSIRQLILTEQPFDLELLGCSPLFRLSRILFFESGGLFVPSLVSTPRSLTSAILLEHKIEYSPIESEMIWSATDPYEIKSLKRLSELRTFSSSLFHEQNHRILWKILPKTLPNEDAIRKYLHFAESLVITMDMALADQLGPVLARFFYLSGVTYDPGTSVYQEAPSIRAYRNYLHAVLHATYMNLENYEPEDIPMAIEALFPSLGALAKRAALRSGNLDRQFVEGTNAFWQKKHESQVIKALCKPGNSGPEVLPQLGASPLVLPDDPLDQVSQYLIAEKYFEWMGL